MSKPYEQNDEPVLSMSMFVNKEDYDTALAAYKKDPSLIKTLSKHDMNSIINTELESKK